MTGGAINVTAGAFDVGAFADPTAAGSRGVADISGGTLTVSGTTDSGHADIYVGEFSYGILNLSSGGVIQDNVATYGMTIGAHTAATGIVNLNGGTLAVPYINTGTNTATSILNFNGGLLKSTSATTTFLTGLTGAYVYSGGGTINNNGNAITIGQAFLAPTGSGGNLRQRRQRRQRLSGHAAGYVHRRHPGHRRSTRDRLRRPHQRRGHEHRHYQSR